MSHIETYFRTLSILLMIFLSNFFLPFQIISTMLTEYAEEINKMVSTNYQKFSKQTFLITNLSFISLNFSALSENYDCFFCIISIMFIITLWYELTVSYITPFEYFNNKMTKISIMSLPIMLMPMLMLIEFLSILTKPLTLMVRMAINLLTGHLMLELMSNFLPLYVAGFVLSMFEIMEMMVSSVQSFVYSLLLSFYSNE